jgi:hypothetical protein
MNPVSSESFFSGSQRKSGVVWKILFSLIFRKMVEWSRGKLAFLKGKVEF